MPCPTDFRWRFFKNSPPALDADANIDGVLPALTEDVAAINPESQQFESLGTAGGSGPTTG